MKTSVLRLRSESRTSPDTSRALRGVMLTEGQRRKSGGRAEVFIKRVAVTPGRKTALRSS